MYQKRERANELFYFHKVHISLPTNIGCRGLIPKDFGYQFNKLLSPCQISEPSYNIYLARGAYGRSIQNECEIVDVLTTKYNFIVLNGTESLEDTMYYFTNAKIMLGAHGSLMKNMIWCKKNPVLIELCPPTRHDCFYGNARDLGFLPFFILVDCNKNKEIILNDQQIDGLYEMLDNLI
jgi:capsular polysaccharide biosynthesis protein